MPTMNSEEYLQETINSIQRQSYKNIELVVIDKNSSDKTIEIIRKSKINKLIIIPQTDNSPESAVARGFKAASGDYIQFLGSDDLLLNSKSFEIISKEVNLEKDMLIYMNYVHINKNGHTINEFMPLFNYEKILNHHNFISATSFLVNKRIFQKYGFDGNEGFDLDLILRLGKNTKPKKLNIFHSAFRVHGKSHSGNFYKNLRNIENDLNISRKYGGHIFNKYHIRFLIMKLMIMTKLIFLLEIVRRVRWKFKGIDYA